MGEEEQIKKAAEQSRVVEARMRRCLVLAQEARLGGDAPVGAVIARDDTVVAEAAEQVRRRHDITAHAELIVIREACRRLGGLRLSDCTLYTTVEPCWMCAFAIRETGIRRVVIGTPVAEIGGVTSRYPILADPALGGWGPAPEIVWWTPDASPIP